MHSETLLARKTHTRKVAPDTPEEIAEITGLEQLPGIREAEDLQQHVYMFRQTHLRLNNAEICRQMPNQARLTPCRNTIDMLLKRFPIRMRRGVEEHS